MSDPFDGVDPNQVNAFLERIARDRDSELTRIEQASRVETARIRQDAYRESQRLHRRTAEAVRTRVRSEHDRALSRLRAELRRSGWQLLADARERGMHDVRRRFAQAWEDPTQRWDWCRYWLDEALARAAGQVVTVRCLGDTGGNIRPRIERWMNERDLDWKIRIEDEGDTGIVVAWDDQMLDGRLCAQYPRIATHLQWRITEVIHESGGSDDR